jgi:hypothetical protein
VQSLLSDRLKEIANLKIKTAEINNYASTFGTYVSSLSVNMVS